MNDITKVILGFILAWLLFSFLDENPNIKAPGQWTNQPLTTQFTVQDQPEMETQAKPVVTSAPVIVSFPTTAPPTSTSLPSVLQMPTRTPHPVTYIDPAEEHVSLCATSVAIDVNQQNDSCEILGTGR